jgi:hypothetical protein
MLPWLVLCLVLAPSAAFLLWSWRISRDDMSLMRATETTPAADIATLPPGSLVEVKGRLRCAAPLTADLSKSPCAHFVASVERDYEKLEYDASRKASYRGKPFGRALTHALRNARIRSDGVAVWEEEDYCSPPLAEERAAVLDAYFGDFRVQTVSEGEGWERIEDLPRLFPELET